MRAGALCLVLALAAELHGGSARMEFIGDCEGSRVTGARVCFFAGGAADNPLLGYLRGGTIRCLPADRIVEMPLGNWNFFLEHDSGLVSPVASLAVHQDAIDGDAFKIVRMPLLPAAWLELGGAWRDAQADGGVVGLWFFDESRAGAAGRPVDPDAEGGAVPAGVRFMPVLVEDGRITRIGRTRSLAAGGTVVIDDAPADERRIDVIVPLRLDMSPASHTNWVQRPAPKVTIVTDDGRSFEPEITSPRLHRNAVLVFRGVPRVPLRAHVGGMGWEADSLPIVPEPSAQVAVADPGLYTAPATALTVRWTAAACNRDVSVAIQRCEQCPEVARATARARDGQLVVPAIPHGQFLLRVIATDVTVPFLADGNPQLVELPHPPCLAP